MSPVSRARFFDPVWYRNYHQTQSGGRFLNNFESPIYENIQKNMQKIGRKLLEYLRKIAGHFAENRRNITGTFAESERNIGGKLLENVRKICEICPKHV